MKHDAWSIDVPNNYAKPWRAPFNVDSYLCFYFGFLANLLAKLQLHRVTAITPHNNLSRDHIVIGNVAADDVVTGRLVDAGGSVFLLEASPLKQHRSNVYLIGGFTNLWDSK